MIFTTHLLSKFINLSGIDIGMLCDKLSAVGLEVESCVSLKLPSRVVVAKVIEKSTHLDADKLSVCQVDIGSEVLQVVCGAKNVAKDQYVALALVGAVLGQGKDKEMCIAKTDLRGVESCGMICSSSELGLPKTEDGIMVLDESIGELELGREIREYPFFNTQVIEISLTPNRGDCLCVLGIVQEISAIFDRPMNAIKEVESSAALGIGRILQVLTEGKIQSSLLYKAIEIKQVYTPLEIKLSLGFCNALQKTQIQNFIEYATYVTGVIFNVYAFEKQSFVSKKSTKATFTIKKDENGFEAVFFDQKLSIIGVGKEILQNLENLPKIFIFEASYIDPTSVSKLLFKNKIKGDNTLIYRSARGSNPNLEMGMDYLRGLFSRFSKSFIYSGTQEVKQDYGDVTINTTFEMICHILGKEIDKEEIAKILKSLNFSIKADSDGDFFATIPPGYRHDIKTKQDIAEELLRAYGIENIPAVAHLCVEKAKPNFGYMNYKNQRIIANRALAMGFTESIHYLFYQKSKLDSLGYPILKDELDLSNPITSELNTLRTSLIPAMLDSIERNKNFGYKSIKIFEIGSIYDSNRNEKSCIAFMASGLAQSELYPFPKGQPWDFYTFARSISSIVGEFRLVAVGEADEKIPQTIHPYQSAYVFIRDQNVGIISKLNPKLANKMDISEAFFCELDLEALSSRHIVAKEFSKYPSSQRDLTILIDENISFGKIRSTILDTNIKYLKNIYPLDIYKETHLENQIALSIRITIQSMQETLKEEELNSVVNAVLETLQKQYNAKLKS